LANRQFVDRDGDDSAEFNVNYLWTIADPTIGSSVLALRVRSGRGIGTSLIALEMIRAGKW
jgi:hypothetical protein